MERVLEKKERSLGIKLAIKGDRCNSPKCALIRKPYRAGQHGKKPRRSSEFGRELKEKQKVRFSYGLSDKQLERVFKEAEKKPGVTADEVMTILESRLDNITFRSGFALSRTAARQLVSHGHLTVNGRKVTVPSFRVKVGDKIGIRPESRNREGFKDLGERFKNYEVPAWLSLDKNNFEVVMVGKPVDIPQPFDINIVVDYFS